MVTSPPSRALPRRSVSGHERVRGRGERAAQATHRLTVRRSGDRRRDGHACPREDIACGADCTQDYVAGRAVTLRATAAAGSRFTGLAAGRRSGAATTCQVTSSPGLTVTATFADVAPPQSKITKVKVTSAQHKAKVSFTATDNRPGALTSSARSTTASTSPARRPRRSRTLTRASTRCSVRATRPGWQNEDSSPAKKTFKIQD